MPDRYSNPDSSIRWAIAFALVMIAALACRFAPGPKEAEPTEVGFLPLTAVASVTPPPPARRICPVPPAEVKPPRIEEVTDAAIELRSYLNRGGDPLELEESLPTAKLVRPDFDGDGWVDLALALRDPSAPNGAMATGTLLVFHCQESEYALVLTAPPRSDLGAPQIHSSSDLNDDARDDLLVSRESCGAHTCSAHVQLLTWSDGSLENRFEGPTDDLPSPAIEVRGGQGGPAEVAITAQGVSSAGAGPFRPETYLWTWNPVSGRFHRTGHQIHQTTFRIHVLHDADRAAQEGDQGTALRHYHRVIEVDTLQAWVDPVQERRALHGYARYRQIVSSLLAGDRDGAEGYLQALREATQAGEAEGAYLELAETFWSAYQMTGSVGFACQEARAYAAAHRETILDPLYFGYTNPSYAPQDICPFQEE